MRVLADTNVLLRYLNADDLSHEVVRKGVEVLFGREDVVGFVPQNARELWGVLTRPKEVRGLGLGTKSADRMLRLIEDSFEYWDDGPGIAVEWRRLVVRLGVQGSQVHDANLAAAALHHGAARVLTLNVKDFERFRPYGLSPLHPQDV